MNDWDTVEHRQKVHYLLNGSEEWKVIDPHWALHESFSVREAALLIKGIDPRKADLAAMGEPDWEEIERSVNNVVGALTKAIAMPRPKLRARLAFDAEPGYEGVRDNLEEQGRWLGDAVLEVKDREGTAYMLVRHPHLDKTTIEREDLVAWLRSRGHTTGFFFPDAVSNAPDYLNPKSPMYAPKLAAAVDAWTAVQAKPEMKGKTPKHWLLEWLRENAATYGLTKTGIKEVATVANWEPSGGAPKTPGQ